MNRRDFFSKIFKTAAVAAVVPGVISKAIQYHPVGQYTFNNIPFIIDPNCPPDRIFAISKEIMWDLNKQIYR